MRAAVVGHVEWVEFARVEALPRAGEIVHALDWWEEPGGGGAVPAVQLARLADECVFFTALGDDELGHRAVARLGELGVRVEAVFRPEPQRRALVHIDDRGERTITVIGERMGPHAEDGLAWELLEEADCVYYTAGDDAALRLARRARALVATSRVLSQLAAARVQLDALVGSARDPAERFEPPGMDPPPRLSVLTEGERGGRYATPSSAHGRYEAVPLPGPVVDTYGAGDTFAACLTFALGQGGSVEDALRFAARCGAASLRGRGPYEARLPAR